MCQSSNKHIPLTGLPKDEVLSQLNQFSETDVDFKKGRIWSLVYYLGEEHDQFLKEAYSTYFSQNGLNPLAFRSLKKMESEVIRMTANLLNGDQDVCGTMTSGGTESCLLAVKTYRDYAHPSIKKPEIILSSSAHVAFDKAAHYFNIKPVRIPLDQDYRMNTQLVKKKINRNTICIIASAPSYPHGIIDSITALGEIAQKHRVPLHVDACLGGYLLPFVERLGYPIPKFDFRVPGVTSISADIHKYGYAAKGASVLLYRNIDYLQSQFFISEDWPGGVFASPTLLGTRSGGAFAAAWAVLHYLGEQGYLEKAQDIMQTTQKIQKGITAIQGLELVGEPMMSVFAFTSNDKKVNIYAVADRLELRGWHIDRQHKPECLHGMVMPSHKQIADQYLTDLKQSVAEVRANPSYSYQNGAAMYGMISRVPLRHMVKKQILMMYKQLYGAHTIFPDEQSMSIEKTTKQKSGLLNKVTPLLLKAFLNHTKNKRR
ncbi:aspartate aminotransferase family protein [Hazenella sp. IB182357]|uniref:Aspartate aminotransferase family protein n=1 Tax=Polycladospora coralii TaxID=2771432 RepID=A0A926NGH9_9BACL|nr:aspartate aminotransferase family protein [Polycladospora coralii]MBD1373164.1 aspartate aminotransferase family protein [Polycladospora coralii]